MAANTPPKPHTEGMEWTNTETGIKYQFFGGAWRAVSSAASEEVAEAIDNIDLEKVLGNGNIADKDIVLTDGTVDLIDISTTEGRIVIASDADAKTPKLTLAHFGDQEAGNRKAEIELDEDGTRLDFEMSDSVKDVHFRFGNDEKFIINHEGDAEFTGKVKVEPGTAGNEVVTASQLAELNQEIEDIRPSLERGLWAYDSSKTSPSSGKYIGYKLAADSTYCNEQLVACQLAAGGDPTAMAACTREHGECTANIGNPVLEVNWSDVDFIAVNKQDSNGELHTFTDVEIGMYVEVMDVDGGGFGLYQIVEPGIAAGGQTSGFWVQHVSSEGRQGGSVRIKVFEMASANPADYVSKNGDQMSGELRVLNEKSSECLYLKGAGDGSVMYVRGPEDVTLFRVKADGKVQAGSTPNTAFMPTSDNDVSTKKYVDQKLSELTRLTLGPARLAWRWLGAFNDNTAPEDGGFYLSENKYLRLSFKSNNHVNLNENLFPDTNFVTTQYGPFGTIWKYNERDNTWQLMRQIRVDGWRWNMNNHHEYLLSSSRGREFDDLVLRQPYYITIGGFF